jgi:hypothetical protein
MAILQFPFWGVGANYIVDIADGAAGFCLIVPHFETECGFEFLNEINGTPFWV